MILDTHLHSNYSDGFHSPMIMAKHLKSLGLDGFALTDHDTIKGHGAAKKAAKEFGLEFIPGIEVSSKQGHIIGLGVEEHIPRGHANEVVEKIREAGGVAVAAHPYDIFRHGVRGTIRKVDFDYIEVFNAREIFWFLNDMVEKAADELGINKIVGSDAHDLPCMGLGTIRVSEAEDLYKGKVEIHKKEWAGITRISVEKTKRVLNKLGIVKFSSHPQEPSH